MDMESVIKSNTKGMREIVTRLEKKVKEKNEEIEDMKKTTEKTAVKNEMLVKEISELKIQDIVVFKLTKALQQEKKISEKTKTQLDALRISNGVLERKIIKLEKDNKHMEGKLRINEEGLEYLVQANRPLEKAYKSLQRKYQIAADQVEQGGQGKTGNCDGNTTI